MENIKESILGAAKQCFARFGYAKTTLEDIGRGVGLKKNSLYHYYKNKEEIFLLVVDQEISSIISEYKAEFKESCGLRNNVINYVQRRLNRCKQASVYNSILTDLHLSQSPLLNEVIKRTYRSETEYLESVFKNAFERREIIDADFVMYAKSILLICDSIKQQDYRINPEIISGSIQSWDTYILFIVDRFLISIEE